MQRYQIHGLITVFLSILGSIQTLAGDKTLTFEDIMHFREIQHPVISNNGEWIAFSAKPDRGNSELEIISPEQDIRYFHSRASRPVFSESSEWLAAKVDPDFLELEKKSGEDKPKTGACLIDLSTGKQLEFEKIQSFIFSKDSAWFAYLAYPEDESQESKKERAEEEKEAEKAEKDGDKKEKKPGGLLILRHLSSGEEIRIETVDQYSFDPASEFLVYSIREKEGENNGLYSRKLSIENTRVDPIHRLVNGSYSPPAWCENISRLAIISAESDSEKNGILHIWIAGEGNSPQSVEGLEGDFTIPLKNSLAWTKDGARLFFGFRSKEADHPTEKGEDSEKADPFDREAILEKKEADIWHWNDPRIIPHQKNIWNDTRDKTFQAVLHWDSMNVVTLADESLPDVQVTENGANTLGFSDKPYLKAVTWEGNFRDAYLVSLRDGSRKKFGTRIHSQPSLSPSGRYAVYYQDRHWHLFDFQNESTKNLTRDLEFPFADEDHDYPSQVPGYGAAGWLEDDEAVFIYDKYDIWMFSPNGADPRLVTHGKGRKQKVTYRLIRTNPDQLHWKKDSSFLLSAYHDSTKKWGFYSLKIGGELRVLREGNFRYQFLSKAKNTEKIIYTRESYNEFPDLWYGDLNLDSARKITDVNPQKSDFAWGEAELVEWSSMDGIPLQGVLIKPGNYEPGKRYPVLVYFYRFFSQRLNEFNQVVINHRPCFPFYASNGYAVFLPDIRFEIGRPGFAATKCLVPGVQKLIDLGIADPDAIGLHGHSWSGYQTAFVVTQTDIFAAAIAGAPVSNMTSAYSGIRWGSGLARQFQYEKTQSRIGGSLWEYPERYIENSPVFFADKIETPLLIMFGDEDGAVPWYQGIELYLAMRRLEKDAIFLQYRGEPHHLQKYPNKLDYSIKMKEYLDHYLKGESAPKWISDGIPYEGE
jgi:dipeptidyl aminopeptidase/acylaminoacyl peptidase